jgi:Skp family chaperone for outer membrane proteins
VISVSNRFNNARFRAGRAILRIRAGRAILRIRAGRAIMGACAAAALATAPGGHAHAQSNPGYFIPQAQQQPAPAAAQPHGRRGRAATAPTPVQAAPLPEPPIDDQEQGSGELTEAQLQEQAAHLPQPPVPPLPDLVSPLYTAVATGDAVKVAAIGNGAALPAPLAADTTYYVIKEGANEVQLASSAANASAGTPVTLDNTGTGTLRLTAPMAHTGAKNLAADFTVRQPGTLKLMTGGVAPPMAVVGVLGVPDVMHLSNAAQIVQHVIGARKEALQAEVQRTQAQWQEMEQSLQADAAKLTRDQVLARERALRARVSTDRRALQNKNRIIQEAGQVGLGQIERTLIGIIRQVAESRGMNLVLHRSQVALNVQEFDITDAVAAQLNRALPTVQIPADGVDPATLPKDWGTPAAAH